MNGHPSRLRFVLYSHDGLGLGHFRRNLVLGRAIVDRYPGASVLLACGAEGIDTFELPPGVDVLRLPGLRKVRNGRYIGRRLSLAPAELRTIRASLLSSAVFHFRPHVLLADKHPLGVDGELVPALGLQQHDDRRAALGLRDVLDDADGTEQEWSHPDLREGVGRYYQRLLVYGSLNLLSPFPAQSTLTHLARMVRYCGYVTGRTHAGAAVDDLPQRDDRPLVLATVGGGEDGMPVLEAFLRAARSSPWNGAIVAGPQMEAQAWDRLSGVAAAAGVAAFRSVPEVARWYRHADALVVMGGYNTLVEALSSGTPAVCVPRTQPRKEQLVRARAFAARGLLGVVEPDELTPLRLADAIRDALAADRRLLAERVRATLDLGGAERAAGYLIELAEETLQPRQPSAAASEPRHRIDQTWRSPASRPLRAAR